MGMNEIKEGRNTELGEKRPRIEPSTTVSRKGLTSQSLEKTFSEEMYELLKINFS